MNASPRRAMPRVHSCAQMGGLPTLVFARRVTVDGNVKSTSMNAAVVRARMMPHVLTLSMNIGENGLNCHGKIQIKKKGCI